MSGPLRSATLLLTSGLILLATPKASARDHEGRPAAVPEVVRLGPLAVPLGRHGDWFIHAARGRLVVSPFGVRRGRAPFVALVRFPGERRRFAVTLYNQRVAGEEGATPGAAGIAWQGDGVRHELLLRRDSRVTLVEARGSGSGWLAAWSLAAPPLGEQRLELMELGDRVRVLLNGRLLGEADDPGLGERAGIVAYPPGAHQFLSFEGGAAPAAPQPGPQAGTVPPPRIAAPRTPPSAPPPATAPAPWPQRPPQASPQVAAPEPPPPIIADDATGEGGVREIVRYYRGLVNALTSGRGLPRSPGRPAAGWERYEDPTLPIVTLHHPAGWQVTSLARSSNGLMVDFADIRLVSPDRRHVILIGRETIQDLVRPERRVNEVLLRQIANLGPSRELANEVFEVRNDRYLLQADVALRAVRAGAYVVVAVASVANAHYLGRPLPPSLVGTAVIIGPAARFSRMARTVYLPILNSATSW